MAARKFEKWLDVSPGDRPGKVAVRALRIRLEAVWRYLRRAAKKPDKDPQYLHELRSWIRRAGAAFELFDKLLPRRRAARLRKQLDRLRRATNEARDLDVLVQRLAQEPGNPARDQWLKSVRRQRTEAQEPIVANYKRLKRKGRFERWVETFLARIESRNANRETSRGGRFDVWARRRLRSLVDAFLQAEPLGEGDSQAWHKFRIRGRELRHMMEVISGAFGTDFRAELYPLVETFQDKLGAMNDLATAQARLPKLIAKAAPGERPYFERLAARQQAQLGQARQDFLDWYRGEPGEALRAGLEAHAGDGQEPMEQPLAGWDQSRRAGTPAHHQSNGR